MHRVQTLCAAILAGMALMMTPIVASAQDGAYPVTIAHALGETTIEAKPERIVTWGWSSQDAVLALGEVPVAMPFFSYGGDAEGVQPWTRAAIEAMGAEMPAILGNSDQIDPPIEEIAALEPDVILAMQSGLTEEQYRVLSQIAPVVAYPGTNWGTGWQEVITITGTVLGKEDEADALVADIAAMMREEAESHPGVTDATFAAILEYNEGVAVYTDRDARVNMLIDAGMDLAPSVSELGSNENFWFPLSYETFDQLQSDIIISYFDTEEAAQAFYERPYIALAPQVESGAVVKVIGPEFAGAISSATALSLPWAFPRYMDLIGEAVANANVAE